MRESIRNQSLKRNLIACVIFASLFHPLGLQSLHAENLAHRNAKPSVKTSTIDLSKSNQDTLTGRLVSPRGIAVAGVTLTLIHESKPLVNTTTDRDGRFVLPAASPGLYTLTDGNWIQPIRIWSLGTAPPVAKTEMLVVIPEPIVAGQVSPLRYWMANPNVMLATAAIAIAVPILIYRPATE